MSTRRRALPAKYAFILLLNIVCTAKVSVAQLAPGQEKIQTVPITGQRDKPFHSAWGFSQDSNLVFPTSRALYFPPSFAPETSRVAPNAQDNTNLRCENISKNPVNLPTGEKIFADLDFEQRSLGQLKLSRLYRSRSQVNGLMGPKWEFSLDAPRISGAVIQCLRSVCRPYVAIVTETDGTQNALYYTIGDSYRLAKNNLSMLVEYSTTNSRWTLHKNNNVYYYSQGGKLQSIATNRPETNYTYNWPGDQLVSVTNGLGQSVGFSYVSGRIATVTDSSGGVWRYEYNANNMLFRVTAPGPNPNIKTYHYEDPSDATLLTGVSANNARQTVYSYYSDKRVKESGTVDLVERDRFSYSGNTTILTDARGLSSTFTFAPIQGELKLTSVSRAQASNCPQASASTGYDINGFVSKRTDWNGVNSVWEYNASGLLMSITKGANSPNPLTLKYEYDQYSRLSTQTQFDSLGLPYRRLVYVYYAGINGRILSETEWDLVQGTSRTLMHDYIYFANQTLLSEATTRNLPGGLVSVSKTIYDTSGNISKKIDAAGLTTEFSNYDGLGRAGRVVDVNGLVTDQAWNPDGTLRTTTLYTPSGAQMTSYSYDGVGRLTELRLPSGLVNKYAYDAAGGIIGIGDGTGQSVSRSTDLGTNVDRLSSPRQVPELGGTAPVAVAGGEFLATVQRDSMSRPWKQSGNSGQLVEFKYDNNGNQTARTDVLGRVWSTREGLQNGHPVRTTRPR